MKYLTILLLLLGGCATQEPEPDEGGAVDDFIAINEPKEVDAARTTNKFSYGYITDRYVIITTRKKHYLAQLFGRCPELTSPDGDVTPDIRYEAKTIRAGVDTIRGCRIKTLYEIDEAQALELKDIGEAPGERRATIG